MDNMLFQWCLAVHSEGKSMTGTMIIEETNSFWDKMKRTHKYRSRNKKLPVRTYM